jgi:hypothetical protein
MIYQKPIWLSSQYIYLFKKYNTPHPMTLAELICVTKYPVCNYKVQFCAFKGDAQNLPLRRVGRGEISPLAIPRG